MYQCLYLMALLRIAKLCTLRHNSSTVMHLELVGHMMGVLLLCLSFLCLKLQKVFYATNTFDARFAERLSPKVVRETFDALNVVHASGILHGDIRRDNILVVRGGAKRCSFDRFRIFLSHHQHRRFQERVCTIAGYISTFFSNFSLVPFNFGGNRLGSSHWGCVVSRPLARQRSTESSSFLKLGRPERIGIWSNTTQLVDVLSVKIVLVFSCGVRVTLLITSFQVRLSIFKQIWLCHVVSSPYILQAILQRPPFLHPSTSFVEFSCIP